MILGGEILNTVLPNKHIGTKHFLTDIFSIIGSPRQHRKAKKHKTLPLFTDIWISTAVYRERALLKWMVGPARRQSTMQNMKVSCIYLWYQSSRKYFLVPSKIVASKHMNFLGINLKGAIVPQWNYKTLRIAKRLNKWRNRAGTKKHSRIKISTSEWVNKLWSINTMQNFSATKRMN